MKTIIIVLIILVVGVGGFLLLKSTTTTVEIPEKETSTVVTPPKEEATATPEAAPIDETKTVIGTSVDGRDITAYHYGKGDNELLFIGGIHGGYEWNTVLVAYELMDYLEDNPDAVPPNVKVTVVPVLNPDGLEKVVGTDERFTRADVPSESKETVSGRFNANNVDLNRNFDCDWKATGKWQNLNVSGGDKAFSEPESQSIEQYERAHDLVAVVVWYSAAGGVFASDCHDGVSDETRTLTNLFAKASGYPAHEAFDFYAITGDMVNWFAKRGVPAISILLTTHEDTEWEKNKAGIDAIFAHYAK